MISSETPVLFAKACEAFIIELTYRAWAFTLESKRRTLQVILLLFRKVMSTHAYITHKFLTSSLTLFPIKNSRPSRNTQQKECFKYYPPKKITNDRKEFSYEEILINYLYNYDYHSYDSRLKNWLILVHQRV